MCVVLNQQNHGTPALFCFLIQSLAAAANSSSMVSIRFFVSGPVSSIFCEPSGLAQQCSTPRGPNFLRKSGKSLGDG